jgi:hypothetical protein
MFIKSLITPLIILLSVNLQAQNWSWVLPLDGEGVEAALSVIPVTNGGLAVAGSFSGTLELDNWTATSVGERDAFLAVLDADRAFQWGISGGSSQNDQIDHLLLAPNGDIICAGSFWFEISLADTVLESGINPRALFIARFSADGTLLWANTMEGDGLKEIGEIALLPNGQIALAGFYERSLLFTDSLLASDTQDGTTYCFAAMLAPDGSLLWVQQGGGGGATRAHALTVLPDQSVVIGGFFDDTTTIAGQIFTANSHDRDAFIAAYGLTGQPLWARKAGGVIDEEIYALDSDEEGNIYATGYLIGVMKLSESISIQSQTGNPNFFLLKYTADGSPVFARSLGGTLSQSGEAISVNNGVVSIGGFFIGEMSIDEFQFDAGSTPHGFIAGFNTSGALRWLAEVPSTQYANINALAFNDQQRILVAGDFGNTAQFDQAEVEGQGGGGAFIGQLWPAFTSTEEAPSDNNKQVRVYPNPASDTLFFEFDELPATTPVHVCLYSNQGQLLRCEQSSPPSTNIQMEVGRMARGSYQWIAWQENQQIGSGMVIF